MIDLCTFASVHSNTNSQAYSLIVGDRFGKKSWWKALVHAVKSPWWQRLLERGLVKLASGTYRVSGEDSCVPAPTLGGDVDVEMKLAEEAKAKGVADYHKRFFQTSLRVEPIALTCIDAFVAMLYVVLKMSV